MYGFFVLQSTKHDWKEDAIKDLKKSEGELDGENAGSTKEMKQSKIYKYDQIASGEQLESLIIFLKTKSNTEKLLEEFGIEH